MLGMENKTEQNRIEQDRKVLREFGDEENKDGWWTDAREGGRRIVESGEGVSVYK